MRLANVYRAKYIGSREGFVTVQFNDFDLAPLCYGWHPFDEWEFEIEI